MEGIRGYSPGESGPEFRRPDVESLRGGEHDELEEAVASPPERVGAREEWDDEVGDAAERPSQPAEPPRRAPVPELEEFIAPVPHRQGGPGVGDHLPSPEVSSSGEGAAPQRLPHGGETDVVPRALGALAIKSTADVLDNPGARQLGVVAVGAVVNDQSTTALTSTSDEPDTTDVDETPVEETDQG